MRDRSRQAVPRWALLLAAAAAAGPARAQDAGRLAPAVGTTFDVRLTDLSITGGPAGPQLDTLELVIRRQITASDGSMASAKNTILSVERDGKKLPADQGTAGFDQLTQGGWTTQFRAWLVVADVLGGHDDASRSSETLDCDWSRLAGFFPIGHVGELALDCRHIYQQGANPPFVVPATMSIRYEGEGQATVPAGTFEVKTVRTVIVEPRRRTEGTVAYSEALGQSVMSHVVVTEHPDDVSAPGVGSIMDTELLSVAPAP